MNDNAWRDDRAALLSRLRAMGAELVDRLARDGIEGGILALLPGINAAIAACGAAAADRSDLVSADRAVVSDDGSATTLRLYTHAGTAASVVLSPRRALSLAGELIAAALRRMS